MAVLSLRRDNYMISNKFRKIILSILLMAILIGTTPAFSNYIHGDNVDNTTNFKILSTYWVKGSSHILEIAPGDTANLTIILEYNGSISARNTVINITFPNVFYIIGYKNNTISYEYNKILHLGSIIILSYKIYISMLADIREYNVTLNISYSILNENETDTLNVPINITGKPYIDLKFNENSIYVGNNTINLTISNTGDITAREIVINMNPSVGGIIIYNPKIYIPYLKSSSNISKQINIYVSKNLIGKSITIDAIISFISDKYHVEYNYDESLSLYVNGYSVSFADLELSINPTKIISDSNNTMYLTVSNIGEVDLHNIIIRLQPQNKLMINGPTIFYIDNLKANSTKIIGINVFSGSVSSMELNKIVASTEYYDPYGNKYSEIRYLYIIVTPHPPILSPIIYSNIGELAIGKVNNITVFIENPSDHLMNNVLIDLTPSQNIKILETDKNYFLSIPPKSKTELHIKLYVPPSIAGVTTQITVKLEYLDSDANVIDTISKPIYFLLRGFILLKLTSTTVIPERPEIGKPFSITVTITNLGTSIAYAASASPILDGLPVGIFGSQSIFIGNIEVNTPTIFTVNLFLKNTTKTNIKIPIEITYMDNLRTEHSIIFNVPVSISGTNIHKTSLKHNTTLNNNLDLYMMILVPFAAVILLYYVFTRRRKLR